MAARAQRKRIEQSAAPRPSVRAAAPSVAALAAVLFVGLGAIYVANFRVMSAGDSLPTRVLPFSLLREHNLDLDEFSWDRDQTGRLEYYVAQRGPHVYSVSTIVTALVVTPLYIAPARWLASNDISYDDVRARVLIAVMERISAALLTALSATALFLVLHRLTTWRWAFGLAVLYGLGTSTWSISSQALWSHALSELCLVLLSAILLLPRPSRGRLAAAGLVAAVMVGNRPQMIVFAAPALLFVWTYHRRGFASFAVLPALGALALLAYNQAVFQGITGGYGGLGHFGGRLFEGLAGLLISPNRGLLVYTPIMLFAAWGAIRVWRVEAPPWLRWLSVGVALHILMYAKFEEWWAGYSYGPRYFADALPALTLFLVYGLVPLCRARIVRGIAIVLALYGVGVQAIGVYAADDHWNREPIPLELRPSRIWDWSDLQIVRGWRNGWHGDDLASVLWDAFREPVPARVAPLAEADLASHIAARGLPAEIEKGATATAIVEITNRGAAAWPAFSGQGPISSRHLILLLMRWFANGQPLAGAGDEMPLPRNLAPGETAVMRISLPAPAVAGDVELELRVAQVLDGGHGMVGPDALRVPVRVK